MRKTHSKCQKGKNRMGDNTQTDKENGWETQTLKAGLPQIMAKTTKHKSLGGSPEITIKLYDTTRAPNCVPHEPTTYGLDLPSLCRLSYKVAQRKSGTCSQCYAAQHSFVPILSLRRDSPSKIVPDFLCATL